MIWNVYSLSFVSQAARSLWQWHWLFAQVPTWGRFGEQFTFSSVELNCYMNSIKEDNNVNFDITPLTSLGRCLIKIVTWMHKETKRMLYLTTRSTRAPFSLDSSGSRTNGCWLEIDRVQSNFSLRIEKVFTNIKALTSIFADKGNVFDCSGWMWYYRLAVSINQRARSSLMLIGTTLGLAMLESIASHGLITLIVHKSQKMSAYSKLRVLRLRKTKHMVRP